MKLLLWLIALFLKNKNKIPKIKRIYLKDVKPGDIFRIEWNVIVGRFANVTCINNDPRKRKILIQIKWQNFEELGCNEFQDILLRYDDERVENFNVLNQITFHNRKHGITQNSKDNTSMEELQNQLQEAIKNEDFELAAKLRDKINGIEKSK